MTTDLEALPFVPNPHRAILPWARYYRIDPLGLGQNARSKDLLLATGLTGQLRKGQFSSHRSTDQCTLNIHWSHRSHRYRSDQYWYPVTPGKPGAPVTGQKAQKEKANQCLDRSELLVLSSLVRPVQLEHNVHESLGNMPSVQNEHSSEHSQAFQGLLNSDSPDDKADESPERSLLRHSGHRSSGTGHTGNPLGTSHTGNRSRSVRSDAVDHRSIL